MRGRAKAAADTRRRWGEPAGKRVNKCDIYPEPAGARTCAGNVLGVAGAARAGAGALVRIPQSR